MNKMEVEEQTHGCDLCKVAYATDPELEDHNWSLMHHIKIEKIKKGSPHSCNLCMVSCSNLIEYGKHLNEDKHKNALSRRSKHGEVELLDSFSGQMETFGRDYMDNTAMEVQGQFQGHHPGVNKHSRSFSQPELYNQHNTNMARNNTKWSKGKMGGQNKKFGGKFLGNQKWPAWNEMEKGFEPGQGFINSTNNQGQFMENRQMNFDNGNQNFFQDQFAQWNWNDNSFYNWQSQQADPYAQQQGHDPQFNDQQWGAQKGNRFDRGRRRGSFDSSFQNNDYRNDGNIYNPDNKDDGTSRDWDINARTKNKHMGRNDRKERDGEFIRPDNRSRDNEHGRGRGIVRSGRGRARSYDQLLATNSDKYSPESNSSTDSNGLKKRRREDDQGRSPGKSRRDNSNNRIAPDTRSKSPSMLSNSIPSLMSVDANQRPRSRSSSRDKFMQSGPRQMDLDQDYGSRKVTWSDQQVSSTTDPEREFEKPGRSSSYERKSAIQKPDSSTKNSKKKKKKGKNYDKSFTTTVDKASSKIAPSQNTESVLERASKLCQKLKSDREQMKKERNQKDRQKKYEKTEELNTQIEELSRKNQEHIKGHLESVENALLSSKNISKSEPTLLSGSSIVSVPTSESSTKMSTKLLPVTKDLTSKTNQVSNLNKESTDQRINKKKDEIEKIRAKIEGTSSSDIGKSFSPGLKNFSPSSSRVAPDQNSLLKMVNSPRSTKERLQLATMLRSHAKSRTKLSLPRFNLKFSDICSGSDKPDELANFDIETLAPSVQLEIANLIEADVKPNVTELERLLDIASAENAEFDLNVLNDLGFLQTPPNATLPDVSRMATASPVMRMPSPIVTPSSKRPRSLSANSEYVGSLRRDDTLGTDRRFDTGSGINATRSRSPVAMMREQLTMDDITEDRTSLSIEDLVTEVSKAKEQLLHVREQNKEVYSTPSYNRDRISDNPSSNRFTSSLPIPAAHSPYMPSTHNAPESINRTQMEKPTSLGLSSVNVKQEKIDNRYEKAASSRTIATRYDPYEHTPDTDTNRTDEARDSVVLSGKVSPVRRSIHTRNLPVNTEGRRKHTRNLHTNMEEFPVRDNDKTTDDTLQHDQRSTLEKVQSILDGAPAQDRISSIGRPVYDTPRSHGCHIDPSVDGPSLDRPVHDDRPELDTQPVHDKGSRPVTSDLTHTNMQAHTQPTDNGGQLDWSVSSATSSVLDQVYSISLEEEHLRQELTTTDTKIIQLKHLLHEASQQLDKCQSQRQELVEKETNCRSERMKLLQESRSLQGSTSSQTGSHPGPGLNNLTEAQLKNLGNPVFIKFLLSQRQSDLSSVGGYSNVETGSQSEFENLDRKSTFSEPVSDAKSVTQSNQQVKQSSRPVPSNSVPSNSNGQFFSRSIDILSGSTETMSSFHSKGNERDNKTSLQIEGQSETSEQARQLTSDKNTTSKSYSLLNTPLEKTGFVTLETLMKGDTDIGRLLHKSLESIGKGTVPVGGSALIKQTSNDSQISKDSSISLPQARERKDSTFSLASDDLMSGSDIDKIDKRKVSMKFMGSIPDGVKCDTFVKQLSMENKNKSLMFTVLSSPEAMSQIKKASDSGLGSSGMGSSSLSSQLTPTTAPDDDKTVVTDFGFKSDRSTKTNSTTTMTADLNDFENQSVMSNYSLGEQIKRMCDGQEGERIMDVQTPRSESSGEKTLEDESNKISSKRDDPASRSERMYDSGSPIKDCYVKMEQIDQDDYPNLSLLLDSHGDTQKQMIAAQEASSPARKKLKSKKERDQLSRRKQKESFVLHSDTNSEEENETSFSSSRSKPSSLKPANTTRSEEELVVTGSEDARTPRMPLSDVAMGSKKSLLDEVQLETDTLSDSCHEEKASRGATNQQELQRLKITQEKLDTFRTNVKMKLTSPPPVPPSRPKVAAGSSPKPPVPSMVTSVRYEGPKISVAAIQVFNGELFVCYNGSELRRFDLKTGQILKELDCSPYLVSVLHVTHVEDRSDILYTGGACKKLMLFDPQKFVLIATYDYYSRIVCVHENWGRLFVGLADGAVSVRSLKSDKELNSFSCTCSPISCLASTSAGMTKMICLGTQDRIIYVLDAITGLLITMLEGHTLPPLCIQVFGETVLSGAADQTILVHNASTGDLVKTVRTTKPISHIWTDTTTIYTTGCDTIINCYNENFKLSGVRHGADKGIVTYGLVHDGKQITGNREGLVEAVKL